MYKRGDLTQNKYVQTYNAKIKRILQISPEYFDERCHYLSPHSVVLSPEAFELWIEFHNRIEGQNAPGGPLDCIYGWACKAAEHAGRIACVLSLYDDLGTAVISEQHMIQGVTLAEYYLNEMFRVHAQSEQNEAVLIANSLLEFMQNKASEVENVFKSEYLLQYGPNKIRDAVSLQETLLLLKDMGIVEPVVGPGKKWRLK